MTLLFFGDKHSMTVTNTNGSSARSFAVVTGASSGIGYELAKQFANNGFDLLIAAEDGAIATSARELEALGASVRSIQADLSTEDGVEKLYADILASGRDLDAIAINAGVGVGGDFRDTDLDAELRMIDLNCRSTVQLAKRVVPQMSERGSGRILFTSSIAALMPAPFEAVYGATKAFVQSFSEALRNELKDTGVTVTALMPADRDKLLPSCRTTRRSGARRRTTRKTSRAKASKRSWRVRTTSSPAPSRRKHKRR